MAEPHQIPVGDETIAAVTHDVPSDEWFVCCHGFRSDKSDSYERRCRRTVDKGGHGDPVLRQWETGDHLAGHSWTMPSTRSKRLQLPCLVLPPIDGSFRRSHGKIPSL